MPRWYTRTDVLSAEKGPFEATTIEDSLRAGRMKRDSLVRAEGWGEWLAIRDCPGFHPAAARKSEPNSDLGLSHDRPVVLHRSCEPTKETPKDLNPYAPPRSESLDLILASGPARERR